MKDMPFAIVEGEPGAYKLSVTGIIRGPVGSTGEHLVCFAGNGYQFNRIVSPQYMGQMLIFDTPGQLQVFLQTEIFKDTAQAAEATDAATPVDVQDAEFGPVEHAANGADGDQMVPSAPLQVSP